MIPGTVLQQWKDINRISRNYNPPVAAEMIAATILGPPTSARQVLDLIQAGAQTQHKFEVHMNAVAGDDGYFVLTLFGMSCSDALPYMAKIVPKYTGQSLAISGASQANGTALVKRDWADQDNHKFRVESAGGQDYKILAKHSGKGLAVSGISQADGAKVVQWDWVDQDHLKFRVEPVADGFYRIVAKHSGKALDLTASNEIVQYSWHGGRNQLFAFIPVGTPPLDSVRIVSKVSGKCVAVEGSSMADLAKVKQEDWQGLDSHRFSLEYIDGEHVRIVAKHSNKVLAVNPITVSFVQDTWRDRDVQKFRIIPMSDGYCKIACKAADFSMTIMPDSSNNATIIPYTWYERPGQLWKLEPA